MSALNNTAGDNVTLTPGASELAELESMLGMDIGAAVNTLLAQELGFIWEVRYWRHLTEGFVIWEDKE